MKLNHGSVVKKTVCTSLKFDDNFCIYLIPGQLNPMKSLLHFTSFLLQKMSSMYISLKNIITNSHISSHSASIVINSWFCLIYMHTHFLLHFLTSTQIYFENKYQTSYHAFRKYAHFNIYI